ncbi:MAG: beta-N-acetylglucosaminidase domain-containing protein [Kiritimatiellia bacterium]
MTIASARMLGCLLSALCLAAGSARAEESVADRIRAARRTVAENGVSRSTRSRYYRAYYVDLCPDGERAAIFDRHQSALRTLAAIDSARNRPLHHLALGRAYAAIGRWDESRQAMETALATGGREGLGAEQQAEALFELANADWQAGRRKAAWAKIGQIAALPLAQAKRKTRGFELARYLWRSRTDADADLDVFALPQHTDGQPFPVPQQATYAGQTLPLATVTLQVEGLPRQAPAVRLLKRKLTRFGTRWGASGTSVRIVVSPQAVVDRPQGYALEVTDAGVTIAARTEQGALWGVVSFVQCVDRAALTVRHCTIRDWPETLRRGTLTGFEPDYLEYALFGKMNSVVCHFDDNWVLSPLEREYYRLFAKRLAAFGIETYAHTGQLTVRPCVALSAPRVYELHLAWSRFLASVGIGNAFMLDDYRFPLQPLDLQTAGSGAQLDAKYLTRLYRAVRAEYPGFRMIFCPPFYWGPDGAADYPEPREPYLKSLGEFLDPEIEVYWTGPRVKAAPMTRDRSDWFAKLIGRKPGIFHNGNAAGQHHWCDFGADVSAYRHQHGTNLAERIAFFHVNTTRYAEAGKAMSAMDWCWNPVGHDAEVAARRLVEQLEGPGVFELLAQAMPSLAYFDKYRYGEPRGELFTEDIAELERKLATAEKAWREVTAIAGNGGVFVGGFSQLGIGWARRLVDCRRNPPDWLRQKREAELANSSFAKREVGFDAARGDQFVPAEVLNGGDYYQGICDRTKRGKCGAKYVAPQDSVRATFACDPFPPERPFRLFLVGKSSSADGGPRLEIVVNGRTVAVHDMFRAYYFEPVEVEIPVAALARNNTVVVRNVSATRRTAILHYLVVRR